MNTMQKRAHEWISQFVEGYFPPFEMLACLLEEVGELSREISHRFGLKRKKTHQEAGNVEDEMADVLFALICIANSLGIDLDVAFENKMRKIEERDKDRYTRKDK